MPMRPLSGVVLKKKAEVLVIRIESGLLFEVPKITGYDVGDEVLLAYNFTKNCRAKIIPPVCEHQEEKGEPPEKEEPVGEIEQLVEAPGALDPLDDGWAELAPEDDLNFEEPEPDDCCSGSGALSPLDDGWEELASGDVSDIEEPDYDDCCSGSGALSQTCETEMLMWCDHLHKCHKYY